MKLSASVRFAGALAADERDAAARTLRSAGATVTSWNDAGARSYATVDWRPPATLRGIAAALPDAHVASPPLAVVRVTPAPERLAAVAHALAGPGGPAGVIASALESDAIVVEIDLATTSLATIVTLVDVENRGRARRIDPIVPLTDDALATFAGSVLGDPTLDGSRVIETYLEPLLARGDA